MTEFNAQLNDAINAAVAKALGGLSSPPRRRRAKGKGRVKPTPEQSAANVAASEAECIRVLTAAGYKDVQPKKNVLTHKRWKAAGRIVRKGEKAHRVGPFNLFHIDQTDPITTTEQAAA